MTRMKTNGTIQNHLNHVFKFCAGFYTSSSTSVLCYRQSRRDAIVSVAPFLRNGINLYNDLHGN